MDNRADVPKRLPYPTELRLLRLERPIGQRKVRSRQRRLSNRRLPVSTQPSQQEQRHVRRTFTAFLHSALEKVATQRRPQHTEQRSVTRLNRPIVARLGRGTQMQ